MVRIGHELASQRLCGIVAGRGEAGDRKVRVTAEFYFQVGEDVRTTGVLWETWGRRPIKHTVAVTP